MCCRPRHCLPLSVTAKAQTDRETDTQTDNDAYTNSHTSRTTLYNIRSYLDIMGYDWTCCFTEPARPHTAAPRRESYGYWLSAGQTVNYDTDIDMTK